MEQKLLAENYIKGLEIRAKAIKSELDTFYNKNMFNKNEFEESLKSAMKSGLVLTERPWIKWEHSALLIKK